MQYSLLRADLMCYSTNTVHCTSAPFHRKFGGSSKPVQWLCRSAARHYFAAFAAAVRADDFFAVHYYIYLVC